MTASTAETYRPPTLDDHPDLTPEEMGRRFLKMIDSLKTIDDLSQSHLEKAVQIALRPSPEGNGGGVSMHLPESGWYYGVSYYDDSHFPLNKSATYSLINRPADQNHNDHHADMGPVCGMDFDAYTAELLRMGFVHREDMAKYDTPQPPYYPDPKTGKPIRGEVRSFRLPFWYFTRPGLLVEMQSRGEAAQPNAKRNHACVERISVRRYDQ